jgi:hypothetical protein
MYSKYNEEDQITIENFISYYINIFNGFGKANCEITYKESLNNDKTGELHNFALIGFEFEKKIFNKHKK